MDASGTSSFRWTERRPVKGRIGDCSPNGGCTQTDIEIVPREPERFADSQPGGEQNAHDQPVTMGVSRFEQRSHLIQRQRSASLLDDLRRLQPLDGIDVDEVKFSRRCKDPRAVVRVSETVVAADVETAPIAS